MAADLPVAEQHIVMLVDDEPNILTSLQRLLRKEGYQIVTSASGPEGLALLEQLSQDGRVASVVVSDFRMPTMNGVEFLSRVRERYPETVRLVLSGFADADTIQSAINQGQVYKFVAKPWDDEDLRVIIHSSVKRYEVVKKARAILGRANALHKEAERVGLTLGAARADEAVDEQTQPVPCGETPPEYDATGILFWQQVVNSVPAAIIGVDRDGLIVLANPYVEHLLQVDRRTILGHTVSESLAPIFADLLYRTIASDSRAGKVQVTLDGRLLRVECVPVVGGDGRGVRGALLVAFPLDDAP
jgi:two-component system NtrC family sensor kinase